MPDESEFQTAAAAILQPREEKLKRVFTEDSFCFPSKLTIVYTPY